MSCLGVLGSISEKRRELDFQWTIENYESTKATADDFGMSPQFQFCGSSWCLILVPHLVPHTWYPSGDRKSEVGNIALYLMLKSLNSKHIVSYTFQIKKSDGSFTEFSSKTVFGTSRNTAWRSANIVQKKLLPKDSLHITCRIRSEESVELVSSPEKLLKLETLSKNFEELFISKNKCDVIIRVKNVEFPAHQAVLTARSSVFAAALEHDMTEKEKGIITIEDCDSDCFGNFLHFLYTGKLENLQFRDALHLYVTADKYNVQELRLFCVSHMLRNLTVEHFFDAAILADQYDETDLMSAAQNFFNRNYSKIVSTSECETLLKKNYRIVHTLMKGMSSKHEI